MFGWTSKLKPKTWYVSHDRIRHHTKWTIELCKNALNKNLLLLLLTERFTDWEVLSVSIAIGVVAVGFFSAASIQTRYSKI